MYHGCNYRLFESYVRYLIGVCACVRACVRVCVRACVCACARLCVMEDAKTRIQSDTDIELL